MKHVEWNRKTVKNKMTFYVSVPKFWADVNGLEKYGQVRITLNQDGSLRISKEVPK